MSAPTPLVRAAESKVCAIELRRPETVWWNTRPGLTHQIEVSDWRAEMHSTRRCSVDGCDRPVGGRGLCKMHWQQDKTANGPRCTVEDCETGQRAKGLCVKHLQRMNKYGTTDLPHREPASIESRFWPKVQPTGFCWEWIGARDPNGYGVFNLGVAHNNRLDRAHRVAWELLIGPISHGLHIDHLCRNRGCCNPDHLEPVTPRVNTMRGMAPTLIVARTGICQRGHSLDDAYVRPDTGARMCRPCMNARQRRHHNASA